MKRFATMACVVVLAGCSSWRIEPFTPRRVIESQRPDVVRVIHTDGRRSVVRYPEIRADSLFGSPGFRGRRTQPVTAVPISEIQALETSRGSPGMTLGVVVAMTYLGRVGMSLLFLASGGS